MIYYRVSLAFTNAPDPLLEETALDVIEGMARHADFFTQPPISLEDLDIALKAFLVTEAQSSESDEIIIKEEKREVLIEMLRELARYVQVKTYDNLNKMLLSGFDSINMMHEPCPLAKGEIRRIIDASPTELIVEAKAQPNTKAWEGRYSQIPGEWMPSQISTKSTGLLFTDLTPGTAYQFQMRPIGSRSNIGDWSDPVSYVSEREIA